MARKFSNKMRNYIFDEAYKNFSILETTYNKKDENYLLSGNSFFTFHLEEIILSKPTFIHFYKKTIKQMKNFVFIYKYKENKNFKMLFKLLNNYLIDDKNYYLFLKKHQNIVEEISNKIKINFYSLTEIDIRSRNLKIKNFSNSNIMEFEHIDFLSNYFIELEKYSTKNFDKEKYLEIVNLIRNDVPIIEDIKKIDSILDFDNIEYMNLINIRNNLNSYYFLTKLEQTFKQENKLFYKKFKVYTKMKEFEKRFYEEILTKKCKFSKSDKVLLETSFLNNILIKGKKVSISEFLFDEKYAEILRNKFIDLEPFKINNGFNKLYSIFMTELKVIESYFARVQLLHSVFDENNLDIEDNFYLFSDVNFVNKKVRKIFENTDISNNKNIIDKIKFIEKSNLLDEDNKERFRKYI